MTVPHLPNPQSSSQPTPGKPTLTNFSGGAVPLLRRVLRQIESWQCALKSGHEVLEGMAEAGCEIDDFLDITKEGI